MQNLVERVLSGDRRALARLVKLIENDALSARRSLAALPHDAGQAHIIGVTGAPGAGKSTLGTQMAHYSPQFYHREKHTDGA